MDYVEPLFRPPSEADSLLLQITVGCSHNKCSYCAMYLMKKFSIKPLDTVFADIDEAAGYGGYFERVFLMDGDALVLKTDHLLKILARIKEKLPRVKRVGAYGDARSVKNKSVEELRELKDAGLGIVYHGFESGNDEVLKRICKGSDAAEAVRAGQMIKEAGITYSTIVLLGAGGEELSEEHAKDTAKLLNAVNPEYVGALMLTIVPGTPLFEDVRAGKFKLPDKFGLLQELKTLVENLEVKNCRFHANHASNYLPIKAELPQDKERIVGYLDRVIKTRDEKLLKPEWMRGL